MPRSPTDADRTPLPASELASLVSALQAEVAAAAAKVQSLEGALANLAHENALLKRRIYGNKTERSKTSELQLTLGDLLATEQKLQQELDDAVAQAEEAAEPAPKNPRDPQLRATPKGRRDLFASKLPRISVEILHAELEEQGVRRIGFDDSPQLMFRPGGFCVLVKRIARYEVLGEAGPTVVTTPTPETLFPRCLLHPSAVAHVITSKFALGVPHYRLEQSLKEQGAPLDRGTMSRYVEHAGNTLGATIVAAMWRDALAHGQVISTDATGALIQPAPSKDGRAQACKKGHFFTAVVDCDAVLFDYAEHHTSEYVQQRFAGFSGYLQTDASAVYDILERGPPKDDEEGGASSAAGRTVGGTSSRRRSAATPLGCRGCCAFVRSTPPIKLPSALRSPSGRPIASNTCAR